MSIIEKLFKEANDIMTYSEKSGMVKVKEMKKIGFFPGGYGTHDGKNSLQDKKIMILGQDFATEKYYCELPASGEDKKKNPTWRNLIKLPKVARFI